MKNYLAVQLLLLSFFALTFSHSSSAAVRSMTAEIAAESNGQRIGKKVIVTCRSGRGKFEILKKGNERQWCDRQFGDVCSGEKLVVAQRVCNRSYSQRIELENGGATVDSVKSEETANVAKQDDAVKAEIVADATALKNELAEIEQKRLDIANKVRELKRRELELQTDN